MAGDRSLLCRAFLVHDPTSYTAEGRCRDCGTPGPFPLPPSPDYAQDPLMRELERRRLSQLAWSRRLTL